MTKADLVQEVYEKVGLPKGEAVNVVETILTTIKETLTDGEAIKISGFGTFLVRVRGPRKGRHLKTGQEIKINPRRVVTFKPSLYFKDLIKSS